MVDFDWELFVGMIGLTSMGFRHFCLNISDPSWEAGGVLKEHLSYSNSCEHKSKLWYQLVARGYL